MGEIRFVGTVEIRVYPYLVCKKMDSSMFCSLCIERKEEEMEE